MLCNQFQRTPEERLARLHSMPWGSPRRMRQRNQIEAMTGKSNRLLCSDHLIQPLHRYELGNRELANRNYQLGSKNGDFRVNPLCAVRDFLIRRDTISTAGPFSRKAATHRCHVNTRAKLFLPNVTCLLEPAI